MMMKTTWNEERTNHDECGDNKARKYSRRTHKGIIWYCHNCGERGFIANGITTPTDTVSNVVHSFRSNEFSTEDTVREIRLPSDYNQSIIPVAGKQWLDKYYITEEEVKNYGIGYSERYKRLILPVFKNEKLLYWQGRNLGIATKENPKYLNIRQSGAKNVFFKRVCINTNNIFGNSHSVLVVVEDILSAIRVGRVCDSLALLGSYFPLDLLNEFREYKTILIYLDNDKWKESIKAAVRFHKLTGKNFRVKQHLKDPKELNPQELTKFLGE